MAECDIKSFIQNLINKVNSDGSRVYSDAQVQGKIQAAVKAGIITRSQVIAATGVKDVLITDAEFTELEDLTSKIANSNKSITDTMTHEELKRLILLSDKARNSIGYSDAGRINKNRLNEILDSLAESRSEESVDILNLMDASIERATRNGNTKRASELTDLKDKFIKMNDLSTRLKIDWNAISKSNEELDRLNLEMATILSILDIGDRETAKKRKEFSVSILGITQKQIAIGRDSKLTPEEKHAKLSELELEKNELKTQLLEISSAKFVKTRKKLEKRLKAIKLRMMAIGDNAPNSFLNKILMSVTNIDPNAYTTSLRELKIRQLKVEDEIRLVEKLIEEYDDDKVYTLGDVQHIFGEDITTTKAIKEMFYEPELDESGVQLKDSSNRPMKKKKESISKLEVEQILESWRIYKRNKTYESSLSTVESTIIRNALLAGDQKLAGEVDPEDPLPISRSSAEALTAKVGKQYDPRKIDDRVAAVSDLQTVLQRVAYLLGTPGSRGFVSQGMLVGLLGTDAQSLFHKFDGAIMDDLELDNPFVPTSETTMAGKLAVLRTSLTNLGISSDVINSMPEFHNNNFIDDFTKVVAFDLEWKPNTDEIIGVSIVEFINGEPTPTSTSVIYASAGKDKIFSKEDSENFLQQLHKYQQNGFKVVGHNTLGADSDMQKLVSVSGNTNLGMMISMRSLDTMLLGFRNSPESTFNRHFGPSLSNMSAAFGVGTKGGSGVTGESAHSVWESGDYDRFEGYAIQDSVLVGRILQEMVKRKNSSVQIDKNGTPQTMIISDITPVWYDTGKPEAGRNQRYRGSEVLFDIQSFRNLREQRGSGMKDNVMYDLGKIRNIALNMILTLMKSTNPSDIDTLFAAINATEVEAQANIENLMVISRSNHDAYLPILRELRKSNGDQFMLSADSESRGKLIYAFAKNEQEYIDTTIDEVIGTLAAHHRNAPRTIARFADKIGFRKLNTGEDLKAYTRELFDFSASLFNGKPLKLLDFGNGEFDYVSSKQLGRGFGQIILGHIDDGLTLSQNIKTPVEEIDRRREAAELDGKTIGLLDEDNLVENREYLPISRQNVAYFAPLSMFEQERAYNDFALRQRFQYILNHDLTDEDVTKFEAWVKTNKTVDLRNNIKFMGNLLKATRDGTVFTEDSFTELANRYSVDLTLGSTVQAKQLLTDKSVDKKERVNSLKSLTQTAEKNLISYIKEQDRTRLEQGRVQRYNLLNVVNNRDIYNRIPTMDEMEEMSLEVAMNMPQMVATWVHDSMNSLKDSKVFLKGKNHWERPQFSSGGPTANAQLAGLFPQISWLMSHPEIANDPELLAGLVRQSFENSIEEIKTNGYSRSSYWDDNMSGLHHILLLQWAYFPEKDTDTSTSLLEVLHKIKTGNIAKEDLTDYYEKTAERFDEALNILRTNAENAKNNEELEQINRIQGYLNSSPGTREFFKGAILPVLYSGGYPGVLKGLRDKRSSTKDTLDPIRLLRDEDLQYIASKLAITGQVIQGRLVDEILGMDTARSSELIQVFMRGTKRATVDVRQRWIDIMKLDPKLKENMVSEDIGRKAINLSIRRVAEMQLPAHLEMGSATDREEWIAKRVSLLEAKWETRIKNAMAIIKREGGRLEIDSAAEREFHVALAGDTAAYKNQMTLLGINHMQNSGIKLNSSNRDILEASVRTGRYISPDDLMFTNQVVHTVAGLGSTTGRAQYVGNNGTNLHGSSLSKGTRYVENDDGTINWDDTITNSAWTLVGNPLTGTEAAEAKTRIHKLAVKNYLLAMATDYPPDMVGFNPDTESRGTFFQEWSKRTKREREFEANERLSNNEKLKDAYANEDPKNPRTLTDADINESIASNSTPINKRIGTRILAADSSSMNDDTIISNSDAKGLAAFRPRLADNPWDDHIVHGLYAMHQGSRSLDAGIGNLRNRVQKLESENQTPETALDMGNSRATQYNPDELGVYFPEIDSSLINDITNDKQTLPQKVNRMRFILDTFAIQHGLQELKEAGQYTRLYQIYKSRQALKKFAVLLSQGKITDMEMRFLHRHLVQQVLRLTKPQRDASKSTRNILDLSKAIAIDPTMFKDEDGRNMQWIDVLSVLADLGVSELGTLNVGMSPVQLLTTEQGDSAPNILAGANTAVIPTVVQGADVALIFQSIWANTNNQKIATEYADKMVKEGKLDSYEKDSTGKYILLSSISNEHQREIIEILLSSDDMVMASANNIGLHATIKIMSGERFLQFTNSNFHASRGNVFVVNRRGLGNQSVSRKIQGQEDTGFFLTPEDIKRILTSAKNAKFFSGLEVASQINKTMGTSTVVDQLRREKYGEFLDRHLAEVAEETDILNILEKGKLKRLKTNRLRDELGLELNLYDAEGYFTSIDTITGLTPFKNAITLDLRIAMERAKQYPTLKAQYESLVRLLNNPENTEILPKIGFILFIKNNVSKDLSENTLRTLMNEHFGYDMSDEQYKELMGKANSVVALVDKINHTPFKGKNKYLPLVIKILQRTKGDKAELNIEDDTNHVLRNSDIPIEDLPIVAQAVKEAHAIVSAEGNRQEVYQSVPSSDLVKISSDPNEFENAFPEGRHINSQLAQLRLDGVIDEEVEVFYRLLVAKVLKHNPHLAQFLSIKTENLGDTRSGEAVKDGDRFIINLNPSILKNMGSVDQVRVFAHEISHIARLAFIRDNSPEWRRLESLFKSKKGREAISTMLVVMSNGKKYEGFETDLAYFTDNPEEFIAQWGSWILVNNTLNNEDVMKMLQSRSRIAIAATHAYRSAFHHIRQEVLNISAGLSEVDDVIFTEVMDITENMFGFTASTEREIFVSNENKKLGMVSSFDTPLDVNGGELATLVGLENRVKAGITLTVAEQTELVSLQNKYQVSGLLPTLTSVRYAKLKSDREAIQGAGVAETATLRSWAGPSIKHVSELQPDERQEIAHTFVLASLKRGGTLAGNTGTIGGLTRAMSDTIFGKRFTENALWARYYLGTGSLTQAHKTYHNNHPVAASLMHLIGESFSHTENQYIMDTGARSVRENRAYAKQWVERVAYETGQLRLITSKDEFKALLSYAYQRSMGIVTTAPVGISAEIIGQADEVASTLAKNSREMRTFIYGTSADLFGDLPVQLDRGILGTRVENKNQAKQFEMEKNRDDLLSAVGDEIALSVLKEDRINSTLFYASGMGPRINLTYAENKSGHYDNEFIVEMKRVQNYNPGVFRVITEITVREMMKMQGITELEARQIVLSASSDGSFLVNGKPKFHSILHDASLSFYHMVNSAKDQDTLFKHIAMMGGTTRLGSVDPSVKAALKAEIALAINSTDEIDDMGMLFLGDGRSTLPMGVSNIPIDKRSAIIFAAQKQTSLRGIMAGVFLAEVGEHPAYLQHTEIITSRKMHENPKINKFLSVRGDEILADLERSKGFRATSSIAIQNVTGITGYDIFDMITIFRSFIPNIEEGAKKMEYEEMLNTIEQKLKIEQGINARDLGKEDDYYTNIFLKYGPDITRLAYGSNLNMASAIMEGSLGFIISSRYGGNGFGFAADLFGSAFNHLRGGFENHEKYNPRGLAINMLTGIESSIRNSRDIWHHAQDHVSDAPTKYERYKIMMSRINNTIFSSISESLTQQAQRILISNLNNGNMVKLRTMFLTENIKNQDQLKAAMNKHNIYGILPHMAFIIKQTGALEPKRIEAYLYMLNNIKSSKTKDTLDFVEANKWIETNNWTPTFIAKHGFSKEVAYRTVAGMYELTKEFRNITLVDPNPWDMNTHAGALRFLNTFYKQFPNLFMSQKIMRMSSHVDMTTQASLLVAQVIADLIYNSILLVALGVIPLAALLPWREEFMFREDPMGTMKMIIGRNPIFGVTGNVAGATLTSMALTMQKNQMRGSGNQFQGYRQAISQGFDEFALDFVPVQAAETLIKDPLSALLLFSLAGGNINEQEFWDVKKGLLNTVSRFLPLGGELPLRIAASKALLGEREKGSSVRSSGSGSTAASTPSKPQYTPPAPPPRAARRASDNWRESLKAYTPPPGLR